jgi:hypothetical protein
MPTLVEASQLNRKALLEKPSIVSPWIHYWYRLVIVADTNIGGFTSRYQQYIISSGCIKTTGTKDQCAFWYRLLKWADTNIVIFGTGPDK